MDEGCVALVSLLGILLVEHTSLHDAADMVWQAEVGRELQPASGLPVDSILQHEPQCRIDGRTSDSSSDRSYDSSTRPQQHSVTACGIAQRIKKGGPITRTLMSNHKNEDVYH